MKRLLLATAITLTSIASTSFANPLPSLITDMQNKGFLKVIDSVKVKEAVGMTAVMVQDKSEGQFHVYWIDDEKQMIFTGDMVTNEGINLTNIYHNKLVPSQADTFNEVFEKGLILGDQQTDKDSNNALYVFYEPFCGYCRKLHKKLQPFIKQGLNVQYIPVAWIRPNSPDVIATVAKSDDVTKAIFMNDAGILDITEKADKEIRRKVQQNSVVMRSMGISGTPGLVYRNGEGKVVVARNYSDDQLQDLYKELMSRNKG